MSKKLDKEAVISLYETGMTKKEVAQELRTTAPTLSKFMKENDIKTRNDKKSAKGSYKSIRKEEVPIVNRANIGYTPMQIKKRSTQKIENALNLYIPEKWKWRD